MGLVSDKGEEGLLHALAEVSFEDYLGKGPIERVDFVLEFFVEFFLRFLHFFDWFMFSGERLKFQGAQFLRQRQLFIKSDCWSGYRSLFFLIQRLEIQRVRFLEQRLPTHFFLHKYVALIH